MNLMITNDKTGQCECVCVVVFLGGGGLFGLKQNISKYYLFCHRMISVPNQSPLDISSDVLLKIILSPGHREKGTRQTMMLHLRYCIFTIPVHVNLKLALSFQPCFDFS